MKLLKKDQSWIGPSHSPAAAAAAARTAVSRMEDGECDVQPLTLGAGGAAAGRKLRAGCACSRAGHA
eukprot:934233-Rhodomonas_salina.1